MSRKDLDEACESGDLETVRRLVQEEGVDVNTPLNHYNATALHLASMYGHAEVVQCLLENKADVNVSDCWGDTPLQEACKRRGNIRVIQLLIDHKADINARRNGDVTALHLAFILGAELEVIQRLLDGNADVNITDHLGRTPLYWMGKIGIQAPAETGAVMKLLLSHNVDLHVKDDVQRTPLHLLAAEDSCIGAVRVLLDHLSSSNDPTSIEAALRPRAKTGCLPFHFVRNPEMAQLLLERPLLDEHEDEDRVVPQVCHEMLFAKDGRGRSLVDKQQGKGPLFDYLTSFTGLPLTVPEKKLVTNTTTTTPCCEHRDKRPRHHATAVPFHPNLNDFQRSITNAFLDKWNQSFRRAGTTVDEDHEDGVRAINVPDDVKYVIMAYLTLADIMKM